MNLSSKNLLQNEVGVSKHIPITHLNSPTVFENKNGMLGSVIKVAGIAFDTETDDRLNQFNRSWHQAVKALDSNICLYVTTHRYKQNLQLKGDFQQSFLQALDQKYHQQFSEKQLYNNDIYITVLYRGFSFNEKNKTSNILKKINKNWVKNTRQHFRLEQMAEQAKAVEQLIAMLAPFDPYLLGSELTSTSELLSFLSLVINADNKLNLPFPTSASPLAKLSQLDRIKAAYPQGNLSTYLSRCRYFFGKYIQLQEGEHNRFAAILSIKRYSSDSHALLLDPLYHLSSEFISTHSFALEEKAKSQHIINKQLIKLRNVNDQAKSQQEELDTASDLLASDRLIMGYHHHTLMLISDNQEELKKQIHAAQRCYSESGFVAVKEDIGQEAAFFAQFPGNIAYIARHALISSQNFTDFCSLHNYRTGYRDANHLGSAVTLLETPSKTPYFFNFHAKSFSADKQNLTKGHTTIIGGNGSGKTVMMAFLDAQASRYQGNSFIFDRDRGLEIYVRASGGVYAILSPNHQDVSFNPLQLSDTPENRKFCHEWLCQLVKYENELELPADISSTLAFCIDYTFNQLLPKHRQLSHIVKILPLNFPRWPALTRWLRPSERFSEGVYAYLFDNPTDNFHLASKTGFDMTHFLDNEPASVRTALFMYIMHLLKLKMNGQLLSIYLDEGWQYANDPYWVERLKKDFPTLRKYNAHLIFATQSPASVVQSTLRNVMLDNCATNIFFANPQAKPEHYIDGFNLTDAEYAAIRDNESSSRLFLIKQEHESCLCRLNLSHLKDELAVLSANKKTITVLEKILSEEGSDPENWLPIFYSSIKE